MRSVIALGALLLLAGCSGPDMSTPQGQCEAASNDDPTVKDIMIRRNSGNSVLFVQLRQDLADARSRAILRCLRLRGLAPQGGVEPVKRDE